MTRDEQIKKAADKYSPPMHPAWEGERNLAFQAGAEWADENPEVPASVLEADLQSVLKHQVEIENGLRDQLTIAVEALKFYAKGAPEREEWKVGMPLEFGCGCCAGRVVDESEQYPHMDYEKGQLGNSYDSNVQGKTAREALAKIK